MDLARWHIWADRSGRGGGSGRFTEPLAPRFRWPPVLGEESRQGSGKITGRSRVWPAHGPLGSTGSRENAADIGVSLWTDRAGQQAALAWSADGLQDATTGHG